MTKLEQILQSITPEQQRVTDLKMSIAARIADIMKEQGLSEYDVANHFRVDLKSVHLILSGTIALDYHIIAKLEGYFGRKIIEVTPSV